MALDVKLIFFFGSVSFFTLILYLLSRNNLNNNQPINNICSDFKTQKLNLQQQKVSKLQSEILVEKRVIKHL